jgi:hypothetical protein
LSHHGVLGVVANNDVSCVIAQRASIFVSGYVLQAKFPEISYADLYTLAGVVAVEEAG